MREPALKLVLFDMDDVLCTYDWTRRVRLLSRLGGLDTARIEAAIWGSGFETAADGGEIDAETYLAGFGARAGVSLSRAAWVAVRRATMTPDGDMLSLVARLKAEVTVALLSNNGHLTLQTIDDLFPQLRPLFGERLLMSAMFDTQKPAREVYLRALRHLGFAPAETLFVDDKVENARGAEAAGLHGHHFRGIDPFRAHLRRLGLRA
jgi:putative hydrolase of the HAD superfamily